MNIHIDFANVNELKGYVTSQMQRCAAIGHYFSLFYRDYDSEDTAYYAHYVRDIAEMVETTRLAQIALAQLIRLEGADITSSVSADNKLFIGDEKFDGRSVQDLKNTFMGKMRYCLGNARYFVEWFDVMDDDQDHSATYARAKIELARMHDAILLVQMAHAQLLGRDNRNKYDGN